MAGRWPILLLRRCLDTLKAIVIMMSIELIMAFMDKALIYLDNPS